VDVGGKWAIYSVVQSGFWGAPAANPTTRHLSKTVFLNALDVNTFRPFLPKRMNKCHHPSGFLFPLTSEASGLIRSSGWARGFAFLFSALLRSVSLSEKRLPDGGGHRWAPILTRSYGLPAEPGHCKCQRFATFYMEAKASCSHRIWHRFKLYVLPEEST
jgi:hypothetical protein